MEQINLGTFSGGYGKSVPDALREFAQRYAAHPAILVSAGSFLHSAQYKVWGRMRSALGAFPALTTPVKLGNLTAVYVLVPLVPELRAAAAALMEENKGLDRSDIAVLSQILEVQAPSLAPA